MECYSVTHVYREFRFFLGGFAFVNVPYKPLASESGAARIHVMFQRFQCEWLSEMPITEDS